MFDAERFLINYIVWRLHFTQRNKTIDYSIFLYTFIPHKIDLRRKINNIRHKMDQQRRKVDRILL